jgi:hypothetical protein
MDVCVHYWLHDSYLRVICLMSFVVHFSTFEIHFVMLPKYELIHFTYILIYLGSRFRFRRIFHYILNSFSKELNIPSAQNYTCTSGYLYGVYSYVIYLIYVLLNFNSSGKISNWLLANVTIQLYF